jgi:hypothetical protein
VIELVPGQTMDSGTTPPGRLDGTVRRTRVNYEQFAVEGPSLRREPLEQPAEAGTRVEGKDDHRDLRRARSRKRLYDDPSKRII